MAVLYSKRGYR